MQYTNEQHLGAAQKPQNAAQHSTGNSARRLAPGLAAAALLLAGAQAQAQTVFATDFDGALPAQIAPGTATLTGVQGFAGLGPAGNTFGGSFLRSPTGQVVTLTLDGLPAHTVLSLGFLFAAIDSLDGTGSFPQGDFFTVKVDGSTVFRESFANALESQIQSYTPPAGGELVRREERGFNAGFYYLDSAYDLAIDPRLQGIAHTATTATITFEIEGPGIQSLDDESWAMDNLTVSVTPVPEPSTLALLLGGLGAVGAAGLRRRAR
jgi:hypothetical protein